MLIQGWPAAVIVELIAAFGGQMFDLDFSGKPMVFEEFGPGFGPVISILAAFFKPLEAFFNVRVNADQDKARFSAEIGQIRLQADIGQNDDFFLSGLDFIGDDAGKQVLAEGAAQGNSEIGHIVSGIRQKEAIKDIAQRLGKADNAGAVFFFQVSGGRVFAAGDLADQPDDDFALFLGHKLYVDKLVDKFFLCDIMLLGVTNPKITGIKLYFRK